MPLNNFMLYSYVPQQIPPHNTAANLPGLDCKPTSDKSCASNDANVGLASLNARSAGVVKPAKPPDSDGVVTAGPLCTPSEPNNKLQLSTDKCLRLKK